MFGLLLSDDNDLIVKNGDLQIGDITNQNQDLIIMSAKGEFKEEPLKGVGVEDFLDDESPESLLRNIRTELSKEGMKVQQLSINNGIINIQATY